ncbi:MAG: hypothetical protein WCF57_10755 [Pyrinomonadaceae bacterium]
MAKWRQRDDIHETPDVSHIQNPDVQHEESDVNVRGILIFVAGLFVLMGVTLVLMWYMLNFFEKREAARETKPGPMALTEQKDRLPPEPRLQSAPGFGAEGQNLELQEPAAEIKVIRRKWHEALEKGTVDEKTNQRTSIPIKDAMRQVLEQNMLKSKPPEGNPSTTDQQGEMPSYSSSGRMMEKVMQ